TLEAEGDAAGDRLAVLETKTRFRVRHGRSEARFDGLDKLQLPAVRGVPARVGDKAGPTKVTLESFGPDPELRGWSTGAVTVVLPRGVSGDGVSAAVETSDGLLRHMLDRASRITSSDGVLKLTLRAPGA